MFGEAIIVRSISATRIKDRHGNSWQYHSRSDRHSKIACWAIMFDLLRTCALLRQHVEVGKVGFGVNHRMNDFGQNKKKDLDLVIAGAKQQSAKSFADYAKIWGVLLSDEETSVLATLPPVRQASVSTVLMALEAKACMTEHIKAIPRLNDELSSSFRTIHGDTNDAIAAGFVMINAAESFISSDRHAHRVRAGKYTVTALKQPHVSNRVVEAIMQIPRRSNTSQQGFDALGMTMVRCCNDGSAVELNEAANQMVPQIASYATLIDRIGRLYATKYKDI
jgi:hypothetical protein